MTAVDRSRAGREPLSELEARLGSVACNDAADRRALAIGGVVPGLVARPADAAALAATVAEVAAAGGALVPLGRGAHRALGHPPRRYDVALVTEKLACTSAYVPADMTVTVEAGATVADLQALLAREGQWLPLEPPVPEATTIGGLLAADLAGPLAATEGRVRDFVIGIAMVTAAGVVARAGGRVVKNVAGYDLMKLVVGSLGTLAVLTEVTFKIRPRHEDERVLLLVCADVAVALAAATAAACIGALAVTVVVELGGAAPASVVVRLGGVAADVAVARARVGELAVRHGAEIALDAGLGEPDAIAWRDRIRDHVRRAPGDLIVRLPALPARAPALVAAALASVPGARGSLHHDPLRGATALALAGVDPGAALAALGAVAAAHDARLVVERWPESLAPTVDVWQPLPAAYPLMRRMKAALDPHGTLAPGRFVGRL